MTRTVNGEMLFEDRDKEVLRKMIWQVADFCGVEVLTYCIMSNHFHVLVRVLDGAEVSNRELLRRYKVLYPKPTKYQTASISVMEKELVAGGEEAQAVRAKRFKSVLVEGRGNPLQTMAAYIDLNPVLANGARASAPSEGESDERRGVGRSCGDSRAVKAGFWLILLELAW